MEYREARSEDLQGMAEVYLAAFPESVAHFFGKRTPPPLPLIDLFKIVREAEPQAVRVAVEGDVVTGYCLSPTHLSRLSGVALRRGHVWRLFWHWLTGQYRLGLRAFRVVAADKLAVLREHSADQHHCDARILSIAVHPRYQGMKIGTQLLTAALAYLDSQQSPCVRLEVRPDNSSAKGLYEKYGFTVVGQTADSQGPWLIMLREPRAN